MTDREAIQKVMEDALYGVWAEYPEDCERALDAIMELGTARGWFSDDD